MRKEWQKYAVRVVGFSRGEQADAVFTASREHGMGERDFAMVEYDHRDVLERHEGGFGLLDR